MKELRTNFTKWEKMHEMGLKRDFDEASLTAFSMAMPGSIFLGAFTSGVRGAEAEH